MTSSIGLTPRQTRILAAIVKENCDTGEPVASRDLVDKYNFDLSPATVRNEMQALELAGFIRQPHTSAGRVPTDIGFRFFLTELMERVKLSLKEQAALKSEVMKLQAMNAEIGRRLAKLVSDHSEQASFAITEDSIATMGLTHLLENKQVKSEEAKSVAEFFDHIDEYAAGLLDSYGDSDEPQVLMGHELALPEHSDYSVVVSGVRLPSGKTGVVGVVGPKAMPYQKNLSLLEYLSKLIRGGAAVMLITSLTTPELTHYFSHTISHVR